MSGVGRGFSAGKAFADALYFKVLRQQPEHAREITEGILQASWSEEELAVLLARGEAKASILKRAWDGDESLPLGRYSPLGDFVWVIDPAAAGDF